MSELHVGSSPLSVGLPDAFSAVVPRTRVSFAVLSGNRPSERIRWTALWESWPQREVFAHPSYVALVAPEGAEPMCACWSNDEGTVLYPFLLRHLEAEPFWTPSLGPASDLVTPYGYGGPFAWNLEHAGQLPDVFWQHFEAWARQRNVVSEFVRFSLFPDRLLRYPGIRKTDRLNVVRDLVADEDVLWMDFKHKVRKNVQKALRSGIRVVVDPEGRALGDFLRIYRHTMQRRHAEVSYDFGPEFFQRLHEGLVGRFVYFHAVHADRVISTELVLVSAESVYSFLGGTESEAFELRPNDLIKFEIIRWARSQGKKQFVLGGGYEPEDGIYQYKLAFAPNGTLPFDTGRRILDPQRYEALIEARRTHGLGRGEVWQPRDAYFPAYRS